MEEVLNTMRATQSKKNALSNARAMELQLQTPQTMDSNLLEPTTDDVIHGKGNGGEAGLRRVIGSGRRKIAKNKEGGTDGVMVGSAMKNANEMGSKIAEQLVKLHGKEFANQFHRGLMDKLAVDFTSLKLPEHSVKKEERGGALLGLPGHGVKKEKRGKGLQEDFNALLSQTGKVGETIDKIAPGSLPSRALEAISNLNSLRNMSGQALSSVLEQMGPGASQMPQVKKVLGLFGAGVRKRGGAGPISHPPSGLQVSHALMSPAQQGLPGQALGGQDVPPGGVAPVAYGNVPQAPSSFKRNTVGMGRPAGAGKKVSEQGREDDKLGMEVAMIKKKMKGAAVSKKGREDDKLGMEVAMLRKKVDKDIAGAGKKKSSVRGQMISKLMSQNPGLTLGQASKYLKENPQG